MSLSFLESLNLARSYLSFKDLLKLAGSRILSLEHFYVLRVNLRHIQDVKPPKIEYTIQKATEKDFQELSRCLEDFKGKDKKELLYQLLFYKFGFRHCYLARNKDNEIMALHWLVYPHENHLLQAYAGYRLPQLKEKQVMIENAFVFPKFRAYGLFPFLTFHLLECAKKQGFKVAITLTRKDQLAVLNTLIVMGFRLLRLTTELRFLGLRKRL